MAQMNQVLYIILSKLKKEHIMAAEKAYVFQCAWTLSGAEIGLLKKVVFYRLFFLFHFGLFGMIYMLGIVYLQNYFLRTQGD